MLVDLQELAARMLADYDARTPGRCVGEPLDLTTAQAYALQAEIARLRQQRGERVIGYKVGCTSRTIQKQLRVNGPIFGRLFESECHPSGVHLPSSGFANLAIEGELAVRLSRDLPGEAPSAQECREAIALVFPVIELHHYVLPAAWPAGQWLIASSGMNAGFVLPEAETRGSGLANFPSNLSIRINEVVVGAVEDMSPNTPVESLRWLAGRLAHLGISLHQGQMILTGSLLNLYPVSPGSRIVVEAPPMGVSRINIGPSLPNLQESNNGL